MKRVLIVLIIFIFSLFLYGKYIEVNNLIVKEYTIYNENIPDTFEELKIVQFSDLLYKSGNNEKKLNELVNTINNENADIIIFSGDLFTASEKYNADDFNLLKKSLKSLNANLFKFAVIGDNDYVFLNEYKDILYESDFILLDNENKLLFYKSNTPINIIGVSDLNNVENLFESDVEYEYTLAITHKPDNLTQLSKYNISTILSGHSLGGVINMPFFGGIIKRDGATTYINDNYKLNNTEIFISNGLGYQDYEFRLFNTPSINVYRLAN